MRTRRRTRWRCIEFPGQRQRQFFGIDVRAMALSGDCGSEGELAPNFGPDSKYAQQMHSGNSRQLSIKNQFPYNRLELRVVGRAGFEPA
jgi:hypothetical protein